MNTLRKHIAAIGFLVLIAYPSTFSQNVDAKLIPSTQEEQDFAFAMGLYRDSLFQMAAEQFDSFVSTHRQSKRRDEAAFLRAECQFASGQFATALNDYSAFVIDYPLSRFAPDAKFRKGLTFLQLNRSQEAVGEFRAILEKHNDREIAGEAAYWIGESYFKNGDDENAIKYYLLAAEGYPKSAVRDHSLYSVAWSYQRKGDLKKAAAAYTRTYEEYPQSPLASEAAVRAAECYSHANEFDKCESSAQSARLRISSADHQARLDYVLADALFQRGRLPESREALLRFLATYPSHELHRDASYSLGWISLKLGQHPEASLQFEAASHGTDALAHAALYRRGIALSLADSVESARACFEETVSRFPNGEYSAHALYESSSLSFTTKNWKNAQLILERLLNSYPASELRPEAMRLRAECLLAQGNPQGASEQFAEVTALANASPEVKALSAYQLGWTAYKQQRYDVAAAGFARFLTGYPAHPKAPLARFWKAECEYAAGRMAEAKRSYQQALADGKTEKREETLYGAAWSSFKLGQYDDAIKDLEQLLTEFPKSTRAFDVRMRIGDSYFLRKEYARAINSYRFILRLFPDHPGLDEASYQLGQSCLKSGDNAEAYKAFEYIVKVMPASPLADDAQFALGWINFQRKEYTEAIKDFQTAVRLYPEGDAAPRALYSMADAYYNQKMYDPAQKTYRELLIRYPDHALASDAIMGIQYALVALGRDDEAVTVIDEFVREHPGSSAVSDLSLKKADIHVSRKNYPAAAAEYRSFLAKYPQSSNVPVALVRLAEVYRYQGEWSEAAESFVRAGKEFDPTSDESARASLEASRIYVEQKQYQKARTILDDVIHRSPAKLIIAEARFLRGVLFDRSGNRPEAAAEFESMMKELPAQDATDQARIQIARFRLSSKQINESRAIADGVAKSRKDAVGAEAQCLVGETYATQSDWPNAVKAYLRVRYVFPTHIRWTTWASLGAGFAYEQQGEKERSAEQYRLAIRTAGDPDAVKEARVRLQTLEKK